MRIERKKFPPLYFSEMRCNLDVCGFFNFKVRNPPYRLGTPLSRGVEKPERPSALQSTPESRENVDVHS